MNRPNIPWRRFLSNTGTEFLVLVSFFLFCLISVTHWKALFSVVLLMHNKTCSPKSKQKLRASQTLIELKTK